MKLRLTIVPCVAVKSKRVYEYEGCKPAGRGVYVATLKVKLRLTMVPCVAVKGKRVCEYEGCSRSLLLPISLRESRVSSSWWYTKLEWRLLVWGGELFVLGGFSMHRGQAKQLPRLTL